MRSLAVKSRESGSHLTVEQAIVFQLKKHLQLALCKLGFECLREDVWVGAYEEISSVLNMGAKNPKEKRSLTILCTLLNDISKNSIISLAQLKNKLIDAKKSTHGKLTRLFEDSIKIIDQEMLRRHALFKQNVNVLKNVCQVSFKVPVANSQEVSSNLAYIISFLKSLEAQFPDKSKFNLVGVEAWRQIFLLLHPHPLDKELQASYRSVMNRYTSVALTMRHNRQRQFNILLPLLYYWQTKSNEASPNVNSEKFQMITKLMQAIITTDTTSQWRGALYDVQAKRHLYYSRFDSAVAQAVDVMQPAPTSMMRVRSWLHL